MPTDQTPSMAVQGRVGSVVALWRYPVKSMMGEELNSSEITDHGLLGDRQFAIIDRATGKIGGAKNPRKWGISLTSTPLTSRLREVVRGLHRYGSRCLTAT